jgi:mannose/fructose/N-acetylgalactosamine-specific phosphotransferase system component IID
VSKSTSLAQKGLDPSAIVFFVVVLLILVGFAAGAYWHSQRGVSAALTLLRTLTGLLWIAVILGAASVGVMLLPAAVLAAVTVAAGSRAQTRRGPAGRS